MLKRITFTLLAAILITAGITACKKQDTTAAPAAGGSTTPSTTDGSQAGQSSGTSQ